MNESNDTLHCVFQQQHESEDSINYVIYQKPNQIAIYRYYFPMKLNQFEYNIFFANHSMDSYVLYHDNIIFLISLSMDGYRENENENEKLNLNIASYNVMDKIWNKNDDIFSDIYFDEDMKIDYAFIHLTKHSLTPILNIFLKPHNTNNYQILSWLIDSDIFSIHKYTHNPDDPPIIINHYNIHFILSPIIDKTQLIYYNDINLFSKKINLHKKIYGSIIYVKEKDIKNRSSRMSRFEWDLSVCSRWLWWWRTQRSLSQYMS